MKTSLGLCAAMWVGSLVGCDRVLLTNLEEREANEVVLALGADSISAEKSAGSGAGSGWSVRVKPDEVGRSLLLLKAAGLPRQRHDGIRGIYREKGVVPGRTEENALFLRALQDELEATLESLSGVQTARVHVALPWMGKSDKENTREPSASVWIQLRGEDPSGFGMAPEAIQKAVAAAVPGLLPERVVVVTAPGSARQREAVPGENELGLEIWLRVVAGLLALVMAGMGLFLGLRRRRALLGSPA